MKINQYLSLGRCIGMVVAFITMPASAATGQGFVGDACRQFDAKGGYSGCKGTFPGVFCHH